ILSGTGSDGALGLQAIKAEGGISFAQDEKSATYYDMPRNAIRSGCVDFELTPVRIAVELARLARHSGVITVDAARHEESLHPLSKEFSEVDSFHQISRVMSRATGLDFRDYKPKVIQRLINRRLAQRHLDGMDAYAACLREHEEEVDSLYQDLFIGPSCFFRDRETFEILKKRVFPEILKWHVDKGELRVWLPGCATGELAYSVAIAFREFSESKARQIPIQIFATDTNMKAIEHARAGIYSQNIVNDVSPERLRRFFGKNDEGYRVN